jgi:hypothetical protein
MIEPDHLLGRNSTDAEEALWTKQEVKERIACVETNMCSCRREPIAHYSILLCNGGCRYRFDLSGKPPEMLEELLSRDAGEHKPSAHHSMDLWGIFPNGLFDSDVCERQGYVAVYQRGTYHFGCE